MDELELPAIAGARADDGPADLVAAYKTMLRTWIDRRPSGTRQKIANALCKHKSFVSQITNPTYAAPVPARHLSTIFEICHFSADERRAFMAAYRAAHPGRRETPSAGLPPGTRSASERILEIRVPDLNDPALQDELEATLRETAARLIALTLRARSQASAATASRPGSDRSAEGDGGEGREG